MSGRVGTLTQEQSEKLEAFKEKIKEIYEPEKHNDHLLLRFLRARNFDLEQAYKMFTNYIRWRIEKKVDTLIDEFEFPEFQAVRECYPRMYHNVDKFGRPIYIERLGLLDASKLLKSCTSERLILYHIYEYEKLVEYRLKACSIKAGKHLEQSCSILDLKGVSLSSFPSVFSLLREVSGIAQDYYPEMLGKMFIVNSPMLFSAVWNLVKPLLNEVTVKKISILGSSYQKELFETVDPSALPDFLGGTCTSDDWTRTERGPWNDGTVEGYPNERYERLDKKYGK